MILSPDQVREFGLEIMKVRMGRKNGKRLEEEFHKHYGLSPLDVSCVWKDLCQNDDLLSDFGLSLTAKEKSEKGFKRFLAAIYWMWCRPKNASMFASRFDMCVDYCRGKPLWKWIERIAALMHLKIVWDESLDADDTEIYGITTDGVDFPMWEAQDPEYPYDTKNMSHKFRKCGAKYIIALSTFRPKCVFIAGPFKGGKHDIDCFRASGLMQKLKDNGKVCIADRGFRSKIASERKHFAYPEPMDSQQLNNFKSRARCRQETFNRRLKHFECLSATWTHGFEKHGIAMRAVAVLVQYQMDNGSPIYAV